MGVYAGTFLIAFSTLALEIGLLRVLSVVTWYHLAFFTISTAMLGMTAGATTVYLRAAWFRTESLADRLSQSCLAYAVSVPLSLVLLFAVRIRTPTALDNLAGSFAGLLLITVACAVPFFFSGIALTVVLTRLPGRIERLYATDLVGASLGCLFVLIGLDHLDAPGFLILCGAVGALAALAFASRARSRRLAAALPFVALLLLALVAVQARTGWIQPEYVKGHADRRDDLQFEKWNSFSRVTVFEESEGRPQYWGKSPRAPLDQVVQHKMKIDGMAGTTVRRFREPSDIEHLAWDVTNVAYFLRPTGGACVIGVGGGRDLQSAILFGHRNVTGVDVNPIFVRLLEREFRDFAGLADREGVHLVVGEARSYLSNAREHYAVIQMSLIDTWAATGAGAFSLSENGLYTVEAWKVILDRLTEDGIFTVSRWFQPTELGETGRLLSLATAALLDYGIDDPSRHLAMVTVDKLATLLVCRSELGERDLQVLHDVCEERAYHPAVLPGEPSENPVLDAIVSASSRDGLEAAIADEMWNYSPPTDESPYFFQMLRLDRLDALRATGRGVVKGNLLATVTLAGLIVSLLVLTAVTIVGPLWIRGRRRDRMRVDPRRFASGAAYFSAIGAGFMFVEIALMQRLSVFLSHPVYALGILLFSIIASTGIGSFLSGLLPLERRSWRRVIPWVMIGAIVAMRFVISAVLAALITDPLWLKTIVSVAVIFPLGLLMGVFFPTGMRIYREVAADDTPWYWALNGVFGVLCSALAVWVSIFWGVSTNFYLAAACYAVVPLSLRMLGAPVVAAQEPTRK